MQNLKLIKKNFWQVSSVKVGVDRNGNVASVYMLLHNPLIHQYTKKIFFNIEEYIEKFGQPVEFTTAGISSACVGTRLELSEYMEILDEEPVQSRNVF